MALQTDAAALRDDLVRRFGAGGDPVVVRAPGRVNLIGEHTDYNDGFVFPMAIGYRILLVARRREERRVRLWSRDFGAGVDFALDAPIAFDPAARWSNYPRGVLAMLQGAGVALPGLDLVFEGDIPQGGGLSSSAALEVATAVAVQRLTGFEMAAPALARLCQRAENEFVGMKCGIMDQFISMMGRPDHALLLDCRSLACRHVPLALGEHRIVIVQSGVKHSLVDSEYNRRRAQCEDGVRVLAQRFPTVRALRDVSVHELTACADELDPTVLRRCRHVVGENARVLEGVAALERGDLGAFGRLMNASHDSLRDLYEVSCAEIDLLVDLARAVPGVRGSRITGGGFGGCTVNLVAAEAVPRFADEVLARYRAETGITAALHASTAAGGAEVLA